ncbi:hypothetical protein STEG23_001623, partial [Scotinomys teguina]
MLVTREGNTGEEEGYPPSSVFHQKRAGYPGTSTNTAQQATVRPVTYHGIRLEEAIR